MNIDKCKNCKYYVPFFRGCTLYNKKVYLRNGNFEEYPMNITYIKKDECQYNSKGVNDYDI